MTDIGISSADVIDTNGSYCKSNTSHECLIKSLNWHLGDRLQRYMFSSWIPSKMKPGPYISCFIGNKIKCNGDPWSYSIRPITRCEEVLIESSLTPMIHSSGCTPCTLCTPCTPCRGDNANHNSFPLQNMHNADLVPIWSIYAISWKCHQICPFEDK